MLSVISRTLRSFSSSLPATAAVVNPSNKDSPTTKAQMGIGQNFTR
jgi:hypothetical protein